MEPLFPVLMRVQDSQPAEQGRELSLAPVGYDDEQNTENREYAFTFPAECELKQGEELHATISSATNHEDELGLAMRALVGLFGSEVMPEVSQTRLVLLRVASKACQTCPVAKLCRYQKNSR